MVRCLVLLLVSITLFRAPAAGQDFSNKGREFWLAYCYHVGMVNSGGMPTMTLYITSDVTTDYSVEIFNGASISSGTITAGQVQNVVVPASFFIDNDGLFRNRTIRVTAPKPIVVYSYITRSAASGATLCLPVNVLGKEYFATSFTQNSNEANSNSYITVIAVEDNTVVEITPSADTKGGWQANTVHTVTLNKGEIYQVLGVTTGNSGVDLTGSHVRSIASGTAGCKRIAVFSGSGKIRIPATGCGVTSSDNLYQQLYPVASWGKKYLTVPSYNNPNNYYRIIKKDATTQVYLNGTLIPSNSFINGVYYEFRNSSPNSIEATEPISVAQYFTTQGCDGNDGSRPYDPDMIMLNPVEQNIDKVTLVSSNVAAQGPQHHMHVILKNAGTAISSFTLDGSPISPGSWTPHPADPSYSYLYLSNVTQGFHRLSSDSGFNAIAYGYGQAESYGYSAGANIKDLYQFISIRNQAATVQFPATCRDAPFKLSITFPYEPQSIQWKFDGLFPDVSLGQPTFDSTWVVNGKQLYRYSLSSNYSVPAVGTYPLRVVASTPAADGCGGEQEINYDLQVYEKPRAQMSVLATGCSSDSVQFTAINNSDGRDVVARYWNFGDGTNSALNAPAHLYATSGNFLSTYHFSTDIGCLSDTAQNTIAISNPPAAAFLVETPACLNRVMRFSDHSTIGSGSIASWNWDFGDGSPVVRRTSGGTVNHTYTGTGVFHVTLYVISSSGCRSADFVQNVNVSEVPKAAFGLPDNCVSDLFSQFTDSTTQASPASFTYEWNFGDAAATPQNPNTSQQQNPRHRFSAAGDYRISMVVSNAAACRDSVEKIFTLNSSEPIAAFTIVGGNAVCSNVTLRLLNQSSIDIGRIVSMDLYWDDLGDPAQKTSLNYPASNATILHNYPAFFAPVNKQVTVRMVIRSGATCEKTITQVVTLKAQPQLDFPQIAARCADAPTFNAGPVAVLNQMTGTGVFSGPGVSSNGAVSPAAAGVGAHSVSYTFTGSNACRTTVDEPFQIYAIPKVNAGPDQYVLEGSSAEFGASASGLQLSYLWSPPFDLDNPEILRPRVTPTDDRIFTLRVVSSEGCSATDQVKVTFLRTPVIPNVFTPNGDGINDTWQIRYLNSYPEAYVQIFNSYGQKLFESKGYGKAWDGNYKGKPLPAGTYYYIIEPKSGRKQMSGFVDIVR